MVEINNIEELKDIMEQTRKPVVVDFYAEWCGPCKAMASMLEELSNEMEDVDFYKLNIEDNPDVASEFSITSVPSFLVVETGRWQVFTGAMPKRTFQNKISEILGLSI